MGAHRITRPRSPRDRPATAGAFGGRYYRAPKAKHELINRMRQPTSTIWKTSPIRKRGAKQSPWEPDVHHYENVVGVKETSKKSFSSTSPVKVILSPPHSPRSSMKFGGRGKQNRDATQISQMNMWKYIEGNRVSEAMNLKVYELPDGTKVHYFLKQGTAEPKCVEIVTIPDKPIDVSFLPIKPITLNMENKEPHISWPPLARVITHPDPPMSDTNMVLTYCSELSEHIVSFYAIHRRDQIDARLVETKPIEISFEEKEYAIAFEKDWSNIMGRDLFSNFIKGNSSYFNVGNIVEAIDSDTKKARKAECDSLLRIESLLSTKEIVERK